MLDRGGDTFLTDPTEDTARAYFSARANAILLHACPRRPVRATPAEVAEVAEVGQAPPTSARELRPRPRAQA